MAACALDRQIMGAIRVRLDLTVVDGSVIAHLQPLPSKPPPLPPPLGSKPTAVALSPLSLRVDWEAPTEGPAITSTGLYLKTHIDGDWFWYRVLVSLSLIHI